MENFHLLRNAFNIQPGEIISIIGAGGKTTLMFALAHEIAHLEGLVITTTTTKIFPPSDLINSHLFISKKESELIDFILNNKKEFGHITLAAKRQDASGKLEGIDPELINKLSSLEPVGYTIIEADGASMKPLKAPDIDFEPVIPKSTTLVIPVIGLDAIGSLLLEENVFRPGIYSRLTGINIGAPVSVDSIAKILTSSDGIIHGSPSNSRIIPFLNKIDINHGAEKAKELAAKIFEINHPKINRIVSGQANSDPSVAMVFESHHNLNRR
jgi:probable selenium-dependent hydroxylase accessory protein YqeC